MWCPSIFKKEERKPLEHKQSKYYALYVCHCGTVCYTPVTDICQKCGCENSFEKQIGRWEWDIDHNKPEPSCWEKIEAEVPWYFSNTANTVWVPRQECLHKNKD